jgi:hypothetical protein
MARSFLTSGFWWIAVAGLVTACSNPGADFSSDSAAQAPPADPNHAPPSTGTGNTTHGWSEVWEQVSGCGLFSKCPGSKGFGVTSDGHYYVGASSPQSTSQGTLSMTEQEIVSKMAVAVASQTFTASARCMSTDPAPGVKTDVTMRFLPTGTQTPIAVYETTESGKHTCVRGDLSAATALRDALAPIVAKYDAPAPQPSSGPIPTPTPTGHPTPLPSWPWPWP